MNSAQQLRQEEPTEAPAEVASPDVQSLLMEYVGEKSAFDRLLLEMKIGRELGSLILTEPENARKLLEEFKTMAPTLSEKALNNDGTRGGIRRESVHSFPKLHIVTGETAEHDPAILLSNEHARLSICMRAVRHLMTTLHECTYDEYRNYRDGFYENMYQELAENDRKLRQENGEGSRDIDVLTLGDFTKRLENTIVNMATINVVTDSSRQTS